MHCRPTENCTQTEYEDGSCLFEDGRPIITLSSSETGFSMILLFSLKGGEIAVLVQSNTEQCKAMLSNIKYQRIECYLKRPGYSMVTKSTELSRPRAMASQGLIDEMEI